LLPRWNFAIALARNELEGTTVDLPGLLAPLELPGPEAVLDSLAELLLGKPLEPHQRGTLLELLKRGGIEEMADLPALVTAGLLASPAYQWC
jgi:hypothetical protein